jgi:hypothetical protein
MERMRKKSRPEENRLGSIFYGLITGASGIGEKRRN